MNRIFFLGALFLLTAVEAFDATYSSDSDDEVSYLDLVFAGGPVTNLMRPVMLRAQSMNTPQVEKEFARGERITGRSSSLPVEVIDDFLEAEAGEFFGQDATSKPQTLSLNSAIRDSFDYCDESAQSGAEKVLNSIYGEKIPPRKIKDTRAHAKQAAVGHKAPKEPAAAASRPALLFKKVALTKDSRGLNGQ